MLNIFISGVTGRVGKILLSKIIQEPDLCIAGGSSNATNESIGEDLGIYNGTETLGINIITAIQDKENIDAIIDFSEPNNSMKLLRFASKNNIPTLVGTTGFEDSESEEMIKLANYFPLLIAPNTSIGIVLIKRMMESISSELKLFSTPEIYERHHEKKRDSPSGTALDLSKKLSSLGSYSEEIEILSERSGESAGEHKITLKRPNELIEISHSALDRSLFADGALEAVKWISNQTPGLYTMNDIYSS
jgi:4-hydroxy-tetrahydrodipicolinate reductase